VALSPKANNADCATTTCRRNLEPNFVDRRVSRGQRGGTTTVVNLSFLDRNKAQTLYKNTKKYDTPTAKKELEDAGEHKSK
jgi:hypothetical protein